MKTSTADRQAIRGRADEATGKPWFKNTERPDPIVENGGLTIVARCRAIPRSQAVVDADFIAHARTDVPALLDDLEAAIGLVGQLVATLEEVDAGRCPSQGQTINDSEGTSDPGPCGECWECRAGVPVAEACSWLEENNG